MTKRERVVRALERRSPDRIPASDSFWDTTLLRWKQEGFPEEVSPYDFFDFDIQMVHLDVSPRFPAVIIGEDEEMFTFRDRFGYVARGYRDGSPTLDYVSHPAPDRASWEGMREKFAMRPGEKARVDTEGFPFRLTPEPTWAEAREKCRTIGSDDPYILAEAYGPHEAAWRLHGFTNTLMDIAAEPDLIRDMGSTYMRFLMSVISRCLDEGIAFDGFMLVEDLGTTRGMLFSPDSWREIHKPLVAELGAFLKQRGIHFWMHSCGNAEVIFEDLIECGLQVINPLEAKAGLDVCELKKKFGAKLAFFGNIDVIAMAESHAAVEKELKRKLAPFVQDGGYIYHSDHSVPSEVSFDRYQYVMELLRK